MSWYPLFVRMDGLVCLVVGGGAVAARKIRSLVEAGARVTAISPEFAPELRDLAAVRPGQVALVEERYSGGSLEAYALVVAATDDRALNERLAGDARRAGVWVNVVDTPDLCTVQAAAVVRRGALQIAVNTGGECPALAAAIREELESQFTPWVETFLAALRRVRDGLRERPVGGTTRHTVMRRLASRSMREACRDLPEELIYRRLLAEADRLLALGRPEPRPETAADARKPEV